MYSLSLRDPHVVGTLAALVACISGATAYLILRRRPSAEEIERERRAQLVRIGRIIDGTILDVSEDSPEFAGADGFREVIADTSSPGLTEGSHWTAPRFVLYKYEIGGVVYECSQDISTLRDYVRSEDLRLSFPCSVRYDVRRPENSIVIAENWSGLRGAGHPIRVRPAERERNLARRTES